MAKVDLLPLLAAALPFLLLCQAGAEGATKEEILKKIDAVYATIPPLKFAPPAGRWKHLPRTMKRLQDGGTLRIVMLGDSIVNDTSHSRWEFLLERLYPKCKVVKVVSVRGSTGCWWYKEDNRVQQWVLRHKPDLLIMGGISQRDDIASIREVIRQVRAKHSPEVFLMTGAFGSMNPITGDNWTRDFDPQGDSYRARLMRLAAEEKCEFLDMTRAWGEYIKAAGKELGWFKRDVVHANERGFQVLGRILERYFAPK